MKEVYGSTWTLQLMLGFILLFVTFLTLTISYSKVFRVKNDVLSIIEKYEGFNDTSIELVNNYIKNSGYTTTGVCIPNGESADNPIKGISNLNDTSADEAVPGERYSYCIEKETKSKYEGGSLTSINYEITMFYKFNLPILGNMITFTIKGKTTDMVDKDDLF